MDSINSLLAYLQTVDESWFHLINGKWTHPAADWIFTHITDLHRDPRMLYVLIPVLLYWIWRRQMLAVKSILAIGLTVALCDAAAYRGIKNIVHRPRPPDAHIAVVLRTHRFSGPSFPSNHATNMFGVATIVSFLIPGAGAFAFPVAALIAYSRVYVGVHYPFDVIGGAFLGMMIGFIVWMLARGEITRTRLAQIDERIEQDLSERGAIERQTRGRNAIEQEAEERVASENFKFERDPMDPGPLKKSNLTSNLATSEPSAKSGRRITELKYESDDE